MKPTFAKLGLKRLNEVNKIELNGEEIEVKKYLPINDKIKIIENTLSNSLDDNSFINPIKLDVFFDLEIIYSYTNISFTEKQKEDPTKLYDLLEENGVFIEVFKNIPEKEYQLLLNWLRETISGFEKHRDSAMGILERVSADYKDLDFDAQKIQKEIAEPGNLELLKDVLTKLG